MAGAKLESPPQPALAKSPEAPRRNSPATERRPLALPLGLTFSPPLAAQPWRPVSGQPLSPEQRTRLTLTLGAHAPLAARIHTGRYAELIANTWSARAVTVGEDIFFAAGEYRPGTAMGELLIAHEVAHVEQARQGLLQRPAAKRKDDTNGDALETQADAKARAAAAPVATPAAAPVPAGDTGRNKQSANPQSNAEPPASATGAAKSAPAPVAAGASQGPAATNSVLMPEPPLQLSPLEQARIHKVENQATTAAVTQTAVPSPDTEVATAREAVAEPAAESQGKAARDAVQTLDERPPPSPEIVKLCAHIRKVIQDKRPPDEETLVKAKPEEMAKAAGQAQNQAIKQDVDKVLGSYDGIKNTPAAQSAPAPGAMPETPAVIPAVDLMAPQASPDALPAQKVSLNADVNASAKQVDDAGMNSEPAKLVEDGPIAQAREAEGELSAMAQRDPAKVLADQQTALTQAKGDMAALQRQAQQMLAASRREHVGQTKNQKSGMKLSEEQQRAQAGKDAEDLFKTTQEKVNQLLEPLTGTAMKKWDAGVGVLSTQFKQALKQVADWINERHSGVGGKVLAFADYLTGLPDWVSEDYDAAEKKFGDGICDLINDISRDVDAVIKSCEALIEKARKDIADIYVKLPASLQEWAKGEQARFGKQLDQLQDKAHQARDDFNKDLVDRASQTVQDARQQIHDLREAAKGLIGKLKDAIGEFLSDPAKFIINGLLKLVGISPSAFWGIVARVQQVMKDIADDPLRFVNNLVAGVGKGFSQFIDNFGKHLLAGFLDWLFSALRKDGVGVEVPADLSPKNIVKFVLQLLGISWPRVRKLLVEQLGEKAVRVLETAAGLIATLVTEGIDGIAKLIKERLDPKTIIDAMIEAGIRYLVETVATKVAVKILSMLNPAGAILQAITLIYDVLKWVFTNASRIFSFVEAVVNGMADVVAGNVAGLANSVERALTMLVPVVIALFAQLLGLDGLPKKVAGAVKDVHAVVEAALRAAVKWVVDQAKKLLAKLGIGGKEGDKDKKATGEIGEKVPFGAGKETHTLWIKVQGTTATVMISSTPTPLETYLAGLEKNVSSLSEEDQNKALPLLGQARKLMSQTDKEADQVAAKQAPGAGSPQAADVSKANDAVKHDEHTLAGVLTQLAVIFQLEGPPITEAFSMAGAPHTLTLSIDGDSIKVEMASKELGIFWRKLNSQIKTEQGLVRVLSGAEKQKHETILTTLRDIETWLQGQVAKRNSIKDPDKNKKNYLSSLAQQLKKKLIELGNKYGLKDLVALDLADALQDLANTVHDLRKHLLDESKWGTAAAGTIVGDGHSNSAAAAERLGWRHTTGQTHYDRLIHSMRKLNDAFEKLHDAKRTYGLDFSQEQVYKDAQQELEGCTQVMTNPKEYLISRGLWNFFFPKTDPRTVNISKDNPSKEFK